MPHSDFCAFACALTFAHRARWAAAIRLRAAWLIRRGRLVAVGLAFAHRARWEAAILARVAAENVRRLRVGCGVPPTLLRPVEFRPSIAAIARSMRSRSARSSARMLLMFIKVLPPGGHPNSPSRRWQRGLTSNADYLWGSAEDSKLNAVLTRQRFSSFPVSARCHSTHATPIFFRP